MRPPEDPNAAFKQAAAERALRLVRSGMLVGLGTGSTARYFLDGLGRLVADGLRITAVATSTETERRARALSIPIVTRTDAPVDLAVDGADEVDATRNCIKGRGGAFLREKIIATASRRFVIVVDESKVVGRLGEGPLPVEVLPFLWEATCRRIEATGGRPSLRGPAEQPFETDNGNFVLDVAYGPIEDPHTLALRLQAIPGVVGHGLFLGMAQGVIVGGPQGVRLLGDL